MSIPYLFNPSKVLEVLQRIETIADLSLLKGNAELPREAVGLSGHKFRVLVSELVHMMPESHCYLELGIFRGKTILTSASDNPKIHHIGVDNYSQFDPKGSNLRAVMRSIKQIGLSNIEIKTVDFNDYLDGEVPNIGVYFYDAIHDYRSQLLALIRGSQLLPPGGVLLVDDTNYGHVRYATFDFITLFPNFKLLFETYSDGHPGKLNGVDKETALSGWWNGTHVIMNDPNNDIVGLTGNKEPAIEDAFAETATLTPAAAPHLSTKIANLRTTG